MKMIIDLPEKIKVEITRVGLLRLSEDMLKEVDKAIQRSKPCKSAQAEE